jgi:hypothetical protein
MTVAMIAALERSITEGYNICVAKFPFRDRENYLPLAGLPDPRDCENAWLLPHWKLILIPPWSPLAYYATTRLKPAPSTPRSA